ncbi:DUF4062 domain-containing protein [Hymenobacter sp. H14-R3]|uniref:DUF4062 domain-containing protein n=1 Tax=Hymenobacter sp. H14-R3 TaxID=3046308 RepID=UPI0024BA7146|nr:DUF4062 domain-containing protein [Hymenobacter sp. H14-R3]MDJ0368088.1 DUF4062 domain-containing protein [Hymenobacter sp. H14-R3]
MPKKYQVFISSTFDDLKEHRDAVVKAVLQLGHLPVGMEMFNAGDQTQWETIKSYIDSSDYYLVILAHRYGSKDPASSLSYTETEYDYAGEQGVPRLGFVIEKTATWPADRIEAKAKKKLDAFKGKVGSARVIKFWDTVDKLAYHVSLSLGNEITINPRVGWVRATEAASPQIAEELARLSKENRELSNKLQAQPRDEVTELQKILEKESIKIPFRDEFINFTLTEIFSVAASFSDGSSPQSICNTMLAKKIGKEFIKDNNYKDVAALEKGLYELRNIGVLDASNAAPGGNWYTTEKGHRLYIILRSQA